MGAPQADQILTPPCEQLNTLLFLLKKSYCVDLVADVVLNKTKYLPILGFGVLANFFVYFRSNTHCRVKSKNHEMGV